jgi:methionine-rich copper-binding protein CopC
MKRAKCLLASALTIACLLPAVCSARSHLDASVPVKGSTVTVSPEKLLLMFSEAVQLTALTLQRVGDREPLRIEALPRWPGRPLTVRLPRLKDGVYKVAYQVDTGDMHDTKGSFEFTLTTHPRWPRARRTAELD